MVTLIFVRILSMQLSKPTAGTESDLCGKGTEANSSCKVDRSEQCVTVETVMWCRSYFWFTLVNQAGQLNKIGSHTIKYFIVTSTNNLMLVKITFYYNRFDLLIVKIKATVLYYMMPWTNTKIHEEKSNKMQQCIKILLFQFL